MHTQLVKINGKWMASIPQEVIHEWQIRSGAQLKLDVDGDTLLISPLKDEAHRNAFEKALKRVNESYALLLSELAEGP